MKIDQVLKKLRGYIYSEFGTAAKYAKVKGVSRSYISAVLKGKREPSNSILSDINISKTKTITYARADKL